MRILLCNSQTGLFFKSPDQWISQPELAEDFQSSPNAILFARQQGLASVEVFWDFDDPEYNVRLPVGPGKAHTQVDLEEPCPVAK